MAEPTLFDEASLALIASGGAGKDGKVYSVKPVPVYGPESVTNGDFATDSDWTKGAGVTISGEKCQCLNTTPYNYALSQIIQLTVNKTYLVSYEILDYVSGEIRVRLGSNMGTTRSSNGVYQEKIVAQNTDFILQTVASSFTGSIDNVSVKEVLSGDGDFTFSRGSNLSATRVGPTGLIEKGRENLLLQSNQFDTTWATSSASVTSGQSGYDGSSDAWLLSKSGASGRLFQNLSASGVLTYSLYMKANASTWGLIQVDGSPADAYAYVDLQNGTTGSTSSVNIVEGIEDVGNGWYRVSISVNDTATRVRVYPAETNSASATSGSIYIQDAQLEIGLAATDYIETGATTGKAGLLEDEPRFDYSGGATCPSLLLEPSRTNLIGYSEYFEGWIKVNGGTGSNPVLDFGYTSPEGKDNAYKVTFDKGAGTTASDLSILQTSFTSGSNTASFYVKADSDTRLMFRNSSTWAIYDIGTEWTRIEKTDTGGSLQIGLREGYGLSDVPDSCSVYLYGAQCEAASYPTSYIPNHSGGSVTRGRDECKGAGDVNTFNSAEGILYAEINALKYPVDVNNWLTITDGTNANSVAIQFETNGTLSGRIEVGGVSQAYITTSVDYSNFIKVAFKYKENDFAWWVNGVEVGTDSSGITFPSNTLNSLQFAYGSGGNNWAGNVKQVLVFKEALSDTELIKLTTI